MLSGIDRELAAIGLQRYPGSMGRVEQRKQILASSDDILGRFHLLDEIRNREEGRWVVSDAEAGARGVVSTGRSMAIVGDQRAPGRSNGLASHADGGPGAYRRRGRRGRARQVAEAQGRN